MSLEQLRQELNSLKQEIRVFCNNKNLEMTQIDNLLIFIVGLPGSGKTTLAKTYPNHILIDDPTTKPTLEPLKQYIITDPHICKPRVFEQVLRLYSEAYYIFFTNEPTISLENIIRRDDGRNITKDYINYLSRQYTPEIFLSKVKYGEIVNTFRN